MCVYLFVCVTASSEALKENIRKECKNMSQDNPAKVKDNEVIAALSSAIKFGYHTAHVPSALCARIVISSFVAPNPRILLR